MVSRKDIQNEIELFYRNNPEKRSKLYENLIDFKCCENMYREAKRIDSIRAKKDGKKRINELNGTVVVKEKPQEGVLALFSNHKIREHQNDNHCHDWRGTVQHEYTHAHDFIDYINYFGFEDRDEIYESNDYDGFYNWTEFHARKEGYLRIISILYKDCDENAILMNAKNIMNILVNNLQHVDIGGYRYALMQFFGRCAAIEKMYPRIIDKAGWEELKACSVYKFLKKHNTFDLIKNSFKKLDEEINILLQQNYK